MLTIKVWCLSALSQKKLENLFWNLVDAVESVKVMVSIGHVGPGNILVLFPKDHMKLGLGSEVLVEVDGINNDPRNTLLVRNELAEKLGSVVQEVFPEAQIDCKVHKAEPTTGTWRSERKKVLVEKRPKVKR